MQSFRAGFDFRYRPKSLRLADTKPHFELYRDSKGAAQTIEEPYEPLVTRRPARPSTVYHSYGATGPVEQVGFYKTVRMLQKQGLANPFPIPEIQEDIKSAVHKGGALSPETLFHLIRPLGHFFKLFAKTAPSARFLGFGQKCPYERFRKIKHRVKGGSAIDIVAKLLKPVLTGLGRILEFTRPEGIPMGWISEGSIPLAGFAGSGIEHQEMLNFFKGKGGFLGSLLKAGLPFLGSLLGSGVPPTRDRPYIPAEGGFFGLLNPIKLISKVLGSGSKKKGGRLTSYYKRFLNTYMAYLNQYTDNSLNEVIADDPQTFDLARFQRQSLGPHVKALTNTFRDLKKGQAHIFEDEPPEGEMEQYFEPLRRYVLRLENRLEQDPQLDNKALAKISPLFPADLENPQSYFLMFDMMRTDPVVYGLTTDLDPEVISKDGISDMKRISGTSPAHKTIESSELEQAMKKFGEKMKIQTALAAEPLTEAIFKKATKLKPITQTDYERLTTLRTTDDKTKLQTATAKSKKVKARIAYRLYKRNQGGTEDSVEVSITPNKIEDFSQYIGEIYRMGALPVKGISSTHDRSAYTRIRNLIKSAGADVKRAAALEISSINVE